MTSYIIILVSVLLIYRVVVRSCLPVPDALPSTAEPYLHLGFLGFDYRKNLCKASKNLWFSLLGISPYTSQWVGVGMRLSQLLNSALGRSRFRTTSAWCGYRLWGSRPPKLRYYLFVFLIDLFALYVFTDVDHCHGAARNEGYL